MRSPQLSFPPLTALNSVGRRIPISPSPSSASVPFPILSLLSLFSHLPPLPPLLSRGHCINAHFLIAPTHFTRLVIHFCSLPLLLSSSSIAGLYTQLYHLLRCCLIPKVGPLSFIILSLSAWSDHHPFFSFLLFCFGAILTFFCPSPIQPHSLLSAISLPTSPPYRSPQRPTSVTRVGFGSPFGPRPRRILRCCFSLFFFSGPRLAPSKSSSHRPCFPPCDPPPLGPALCFPAPDPAPSLSDISHPYPTWETGWS